MSEPDRIDDRWLMQASDAIAHTVRMGMDTIVYEYTRPSVMYRPRLGLDGNAWCALYGDNLQDGVAGFGDSPAAALAAFDAAWNARLPQRTSKEVQP